MKDSKRLSDEDKRHRCEVRQHLVYRQEKGIEWYRKYISTYGFGGRRTKLLGDVADQWIKGNRGQKGDWK
jgi:hypothetical protein